MGERHALVQSCIKGHWSRSLALDDAHNSVGLLEQLDAASAQFVQELGLSSLERSDLSADELARLAALMTRNEPEPDAAKQMGKLANGLHRLMVDYGGDDVEPMSRTVFRCDLLELLAARLTEDARQVPNALKLLLLLD